jgi:hypothetical protein
MAEQNDLPPMQHGLVAHASRAGRNPSGCCSPMHPGLVAILKTELLLAHASWAFWIETHGFCPCFPRG